MRTEDAMLLAIVEHMDARPGSWMKCTRCTDKSVQWCIMLMHIDKTFP